MYKDTSGFSLLKLNLLILFLDIVFINLSEVLAFEIRFKGFLPPYNFQAYQNMLFPITILRLSCFYIFRVYDNFKAKPSFQIFVEIAKGTTFSTLLIIVSAFFFRIFAYPRTVIVISWVLTLFSIFFWRIIFKKIIGIFLKKDFFYSKVIIVGLGREAQRLALRLLQDSSEQYKILGFVRLRASESKDLAISKIFPLQEQEIKILGNLEDIEEIIKNKDADEVIVAGNSLSNEELTKLLGGVNKYKIPVRVAPDIYDMTLGAVLEGGTSSLPLVRLIVEPIRGWYPGFKRLFDVIFSIIGLILSLPILLVVIPLMKLENLRAPVLYKQKRVGLHGKEFVLYKLRTMVENAEEETGPVWAEKDDPRVTQIGRFLRLFRIDEVPQLVNILKGEMSLIGPRPERPYFVKELLKTIPCYAERFNVKPGVTGWAQVNFRYAASIADNQEKLMYDLYYIQNMSPSLDLLIILRTLGLIFGGTEVR